METSNFQTFDNLNIYYTKIVIPPYVLTSNMKVTCIADVI